jgi:hypothetical protein
MTTYREVLTVAALAAARRLPEAFLRSLGLDDNGAGVVIPYHDDAGNPLFDRLRTALAAKDGTRQPAGVSLCPYGLWRLDTARRAGHLYLVEGESDCWALWHHGLPALGLPGSNTAAILTAEHLSCIDTLYVVREPDQGGTAFVQGVGRRLAELFWRGAAHELTMPAGIKDPCELHVSAPEHFLSCLRERVCATSPLARTTGPTPSRPAGPDAPTGAVIIRAYFDRHYCPDFRRGNVVHCADGREVDLREACAVPTTALLAALEEASNVPCYKGGAINREALPTFFRKWAPVAWGDLLTGLPDEDHAVLADGCEAACEFRRMVRDALLSEMTLANTVHGVTLVERRSLIEWCLRFARPGPWRSIRSRRVWCKLRARGDGESILTVALRAEVFAQVKADRRLCVMGENTFARRCDRYGVGTSSRADRPHGLSAVVLADDLVADLTAGLDLDDDARAEGEIERVIRAREEH